MPVSFEGTCGYIRYKFTVITVSPRQTLCDTFVPITISKRIDANDPKLQVSFYFSVHPNMQENYRVFLQSAVLFRTNSIAISYLRL